MIYPDFAVAIDRKREAFAAPGFHLASGIFDLTAESEFNPLDRLNYRIATDPPTAVKRGGFLGNFLPLLGLLHDSSCKDEALTTRAVARGEGFILDFELIRKSQYGNASER